MPAGEFERVVLLHRRCGQVHNGASYYHYAGFDDEDISVVDVSPDGWVGQRDPMIVGQAGKAPAGRVRHVGEYAEACGMAWVYTTTYRCTCAALPVAPLAVLEGRSSEVYCVAIGDVGGRMVLASGSSDTHVFIVTADGASPTAER